MILPKHVKIMITAMAHVEKQRMNVMILSVVVLLEGHFPYFHQLVESKNYNYVYDGDDIIIEYLTKDDGKVEITRYFLLEGHFPYFHPKRTTKENLSAGSPERALYVWLFRVGYSMPSVL